MSTHNSVDLRVDGDACDPDEHETDLIDQQPGDTENESSVKTGYEVKYSEGSVVEYNFRESNRKS